MLRVEATRSVLASCAHHRRNKDAHAVVDEYRRTDAAALINSAAAASSAQRQAHQMYRQAYDHWCTEYVLSFILRQTGRIQGLTAAQARLAQYKEEERVAQEKRVQGVTIVFMLCIQS
jgi:hypothetical protein